MSEDNIPSLPDFLTGASEIREEMLTSMPGPDARPILNNSHTWSFYTNPTARLASYTIHRFLKANASGMTPFVLKEQEEFKCDVEGSVPIVRTGMFALCYQGRVVKLEFVNGGDKQCITLASNDVDLGPLRQQIDEELRLRNPYRGKFIHVMEENTGDGIRFEVLPKPTVTIDDLILDATIKTDLLDNTLLQLQLGMNNGLIFAGAPGTGKSLAAKTICRTVLDAGYTALFAEGRVRFDRLDEMVRQFIGPCVIVLEDIDTFAEDRIKGRPTAFADFLQFMSGMTERPDPIVVIATTNHLQLLDAAVRDRPARFNRRYDFTAPNNDHLDQMIDAMFGPEAISPASKSLCHDRDFTGAHVNEIRRTAKTIAHKQGKPLQDVFAEAVERVAGHFSPELKTLGFGALTRR
jgi:hypothetical protein